MIVNKILHQCLHNVWLLYARTHAHTPSDKHIIQIYRQVRI